MTMYYHGVNKTQSKVIMDSNITQTIDINVRVVSKRDDHVLPWSQQDTIQSNHG